MGQDFMYGISLGIVKQVVSLSVEERSWSTLLS